jgi:hypothetical protein
MWTQWVNGLLGVWTIIAAWSFMPSSAGRTLLVITGIVVAVLGFWGGAMSPDDATRREGQGPGRA